jgi:hypothetical protein
MPSSPGLAEPQRQDHPLSSDMRGHDKDKEPARRGDVYAGWVPFLGKGTVDYTFGLEKCHKSRSKYSLRQSRHTFQRL